MPSRKVIRADALKWLRQQPERSLDHIITGIPDMSETPITTVEAYSEWVYEVGRLCLTRTSPAGYTIFYNTDRRVNGIWLAKAAILSRAAADLGIPMRWHKIVLRRKRVDSTDNLRPTYSHILCFSTKGRPGRATPDLLPAGKYIYANASGVNAVSFAVSFVAEQSPKDKVIVDPFVGRGTTLAIANNHGFDAIGVDILPEQVKYARELTL